MNLFIKKTIITLSAAMLTVAPMTAMAEDTVQVAPIAVSVEGTEQAQAFYNSFSGVVKEVTDREDGSKMVSLEAEDKSPANFIISKDTYLVENVKLEAGKKLIGFYEANRPMIMIYPPQYTIEIVAEVSDKLFVEADKFDSDLVNQDNTLKLNLSEDTEIVWENGTQIYWFKAPTLEEIKIALGDRRLIVLYDITTRSIPAQTTPKKVIVLSQQESAPVTDVANFDIMVNNKTIEARHAFENESGAVMVPVRAIAEALGNKVGWDSETQSITVGENVSFTLNNKNYKAWDTDITLDTAPILQDGFTYVPMDFFQKVLPIRKAEVFEGRIVFEN